MEDSRQDDRREEIERSAGSEWEDGGDEMGSDTSWIGWQVPGMGGTGWVELGLRP